ncbi:MAG: ACT domain-containing protein [Thermoanaerobaculia bacterium]|nr:ACT domain-containing protein [Thermoanaerobaculia bacterium]
MTETPSERPQRLELRLEPGRLSICRQEPDRALPAWLSRAEFFAVTRTPRELSLVIPEQWVGRDWKAQHGYRALGVVGTLDFAWTGILADLTAVLAAAGVSIFALSTFDTDYLLIQEESLGIARDALVAAGHDVEL